MLNSNFDLRTFLTESKNPTISEGAKFKVGDMVKLSGGEPTEVLAVRKMTDSDLHAYSIKNSKGERAEYDETQLSAANVDEVLSEATVMEYIRERMDRMNDEVRECMKEYIQRCNAIDPHHENAHAELMNALENFYNKLKTHFEAEETGDASHLATNDEVPYIDLEEGPVYPEDKHTMTPDEFEEDAFGGEEDEVNEEEVEEGNAFSAARAKAVEDGKDEFEVDGKTYKVNETEDVVKEDYEPRTKEDLVFQYLRDAWQFGAMKGKDVSPDEELSTMADSLLANLPDYDSAERVDEQAESLQSIGEKIEEKLKALGLQTKVFGGEFEVPKSARDMIAKNNKLGALAYSRDKSIFAGHPEYERLEVIIHKDHLEDLKKIANEFKMPSGSVQAFAGTGFVRLRHTADVVGESVEIVSEGLDPETVKLLLGMAKLAVTAGTVPAALGILYQYKDHPKIAKAIEAFERHLDK